MARPEFEPSSFQREKVEIWAGGGMPQQAMADALGISRNTLLKHFERELAIGAAKRRADVVEAMYRSARKGSVSAQKAYLAAGDAAPRLPANQPAAPEPEPKPEPVGKKEAARRAARTAHEGNVWGELVRH